MSTEYTPSLFMQSTSGGEFYLHIILNSKITEFTKHNFANKSNNSHLISDNIKLYKIALSSKPKIPCLKMVLSIIRSHYNTVFHFYRYNSKLTLLALPSVIYEPRFRGSIRNLVYSDQPSVPPRRQEMRQPRDMKVR